MQVLKICRNIPVISSGVPSGLLSQRTLFAVGLKKNSPVTYLHSGWCTDNECVFLADYELCSYNNQLVLKHVSYNYRFDVLKFNWKSVSHLTPKTCLLRTLPKLIVRGWGFAGLHGTSCNCLGELVAHVLIKKLVQQFSQAFVLGFLKTSLAYSQLRQAWCTGHRHLSGDLISIKFNTGTVIMIVCLIT